MRKSDGSLMSAKEEDDLIAKKKALEKMQNVNNDKFTLERMRKRDDEVRAMPSKESNFGENISNISKSAARNAAKYLGKTAISVGDATVGKVAKPIVSGINEFVNKERTFPVPYKLNTGNIAGSDRDKRKEQIEYEKKKKDGGGMFNQSSQR